jgi:hypothetical protein
MNLAFAGGRRVANYPCIKCGNYKMLLLYDMHGHLAKDRFMPNYLVWCNHKEVEPVVAPESDGNEDEDWVNDMIADICREYDPGSGE